MFRLPGILAITFILMFSQVWAAGPFDGEWKGRAPVGGTIQGATARSTDTGRPCPAFEARMRITDSAITGQIDFEPAPGPITGRVDQSGGVVGRLGDIPFSGKIDGTRLTATYVGPACGQRTLVLDKVQ